MMGTTLSPKLSLSLCGLCDCKARKPLQPRTPSTTCRVRQTFRCQSGTLVPRAKTLSVEKKFLGAIQIFAAGLTANPYRPFRSLCSIQRCGQSNPLDTLVRAAKHHQHDQIARWIFDGVNLCFCHLQNRPCNNYCTHPRVCEDPSHPRLDVVLKV